MSMDTARNSDFIGKMEERIVSMDVDDYVKADIEFGDFKAVLRLDKIVDEKDEYRSSKFKLFVEVKSASDIELGLSVHLKFPPFENEWTEQPGEFHSSTICVIAIGTVKQDFHVMEFEDRWSPFDDDDPLAVVHARVKAFWTEHRPVCYEIVDKKANVEIGKEIIEIDCKNLSGFSDYFSGYFRSNWKEAVENKYEVKDCTMAQFADLLAVIHPYISKPIDSSNVGFLLEMARKYFIPSVTRKCECFLIERMNRKEKMVENIELAENYELQFARELLPATFGDAAKFRLLLNDDKFASLPGHVKARINQTYVDIDLKNNAVLPQEIDDMEQ